MHDLPSTGTWARFVSHPSSLSNGWLGKIVHEKIHDEVVERLKKAYSQVKIGDPLEAGTLYGPLHTKQSVKLFLNAVSEAQKSGGQVIVGGKVRAGVSSNRPGKLTYPAKSSRRSRPWRATTSSRPS